MCNDNKKCSYLINGERLGADWSLLLETGVARRCVTRARRDSHGNGAAHGHSQVGLDDLEHVQFDEHALLNALRYFVAGVEIKEN